MSGSEPRTKPDYYEKPLTEDSRRTRAFCEDQLDALDAKLDDAKGISRLKLQKSRDRKQLALDWQGANPKELDLDELTAVIREPLFDDATEDTYRGKIKNQKTAIRAYCVMCMGGSVAGIRDCTSTTCPLFPFRMGGDPLRGFDIPRVEEPELSAEAQLEDAQDEDIDDGEDDEEDDFDED